MKRIAMTKDLTFSNIVAGFGHLMEWGWTKEQMNTYIHQLLELGITTMDNADSYGRYTAEEFFGQALKMEPGLRDQLELVSKVGIVYPDDNVRVKYYDYTTEHIIDHAQRSLEYYGTDHLDLLLLHRPSMIMDPAQIAEAFDKLYQQGKVRHFGVSNFTVDQTNMLASYCSRPLITNQFEFSVMDMEHIDSGVLDQCMEYRIHPMYYSPMGAGRLFEDSDTARRAREMLETVREEIGASDFSTVIYSWLLKHPAQGLPICGSGKIERMKAAVEALEKPLTLEQWFMIWTAVKGHKVP
ncbi:MAG: aldo/keto reductase [Erysipelotrichaceae bacterium]|nr:aldo/keto reductase [Erysipelotrichaceae bacterium]